MGLRGFRVCLTVWLSTSVLLPIRPVPGCPENPPNIKTKPPEISFYIREGGGGRFNIRVRGKGLHFTLLGIILPTIKLKVYTVWGFYLDHPGPEADYLQHPEGPS